MISEYKRFAITRLSSLSSRFLPFADVATEELPMSRLLRLSLFQITVGMALVLMVGTLNRVMIVELQVPATLVAAMLALPLLFAPFRALIGFRSDNYKSALGLRRLPYIWKGSMLQFGGFAIMPFALLVLSGYGEAIDAPRWIGLVSAALSFLLVGAGMHMVQTVGLALATDLVPEEDQPKVVGLMYVMLLLGMIVSAFVFGALLEEYTPGRLIRVIQACAVVTLVLNSIAMWKQESRDRNRAKNPAPQRDFSSAWRQLMARKGMMRLLIMIGLGTAGFGMADVLLEPFGGQVLEMSVAQTVRLNVGLAFGTLLGFGMASYWLGKQGNPIDVVSLGTVLGVAAFVLLVLSSFTISVPALVGATLMAGFAAGLFSHGTLTMTMRSAPKEQIGLSLGTWGAVQTTSAGIAIAIGGVIRDVLHTGNIDGTASATPYVAVFSFEAALLLLAIIVTLPLRKYGIEAVSATVTKKKSQVHESLALNSMRGD